MPEDLMQYDKMARNALRGVIKSALKKAVDGLPGEHHFYIAFRTCGSGVQISSRLLEKYPSEMTIVLQHQFWDLDVQDDQFSIGLSFSNIPERLVVPYSAVISFYDPTVQFGLQFEDGQEDGGLEPDLETEETGAAPAADPAPEQSQDKHEENGVVSLDAFRKKK